MKANNRHFLIFGLLAAAAALVVVFWPTVYDALILPVALLLWAFLRLLLSLDQAVYWVILICAGFLIAVRSLSAEPAVPREASQTAARPSDSRVAAWRAMIAGCTHSREERLALQKCLTGLLRTAAENEDPGQPAAMQDLDAALRQRLPDPLVSFLSMDLSRKSHRPSTGWEALIRRVRNWVQRSTRKPPLDTYTAIEEILLHLESYLEKPNESTPNPPPVH